MEKRYNFYNLEPQFRTFLLAENISPITLKNYLSDFRHFAGWLTTNNKFAISRKENALGLPITSEDISNYRSYLYQNNLPQKTINRRLSTVRKFCSFCISQGWLTENPAKGITNLNNQIQYAVQSKKDHGIGSPETQLKDNKDKAFISLKSLKKITYWLGKKISSARTRPPSPASNFLPQYYIAFIIIMIFVASLGAGIYNQFFKKSEQTFAYPSSPIRAGRILSFQGRLTDALGNPINTATNITFKLYKDPTGGSALYTAGACSLTPDSTGVFNVLVGGSGYSPTPPQAVCGVEIDSSIFSENPNIYMGITVAGDSEMTPRQQIANVGYAINAETLQGLPPGSAISSVPFINKDGNMLIAASSPGIRSTYASSTFTLSSAQATTIQSAGAGDITLQATESGALRFRTGGNSDSYTRLFIDTAGNGGNVGIGTTGPDRKLDVLDASNPQLRLTQADGSKYTDFQTDSSGNLTVTPNGGLANVTGGLDVSGTFKAGTSDAFQVDSSGNTTLSNQASLKLYEATVNGTNYVGLQAPSSLAADNSYTLPNAYPGAATGYYLTSNTSGAMSWSNSITASSLKWNTLTNPDGNLSLSMGTNTTGFNWATGTSTNNLLSLTTDNSANGTGALLNLQTGTSSTVLPLRVRAGSTDALMVNSSGVVGIGTTGPDRKLDVLDASNPQLRLTQADGSKYTDFQTDSSGNLTVTPNGGLANVTGSLAASSILQVGGSTPVTYSRFGTSTSGWGLSGASDVLISGKMEIDSQLYVDGTGSNYFVGSLGVGTNNLNNLLTVGSYNSAVSSSLKQGLLSVDNILLSQLEGGSYFGNIRLTENQFGLINYGNTWTA
ncbi:site-specific integrase, partial [Patescibacteria group bacterium]|nr:site-specific integrase [Patescibacteria group bacterium]